MRADEPEQQMDSIEPTEERIAVTAGELSCLVWRRGSGHRATIIMTHGTGFCASVWGTVAAGLTDAFDVVAIDRRGHGRSMKPRDATYDFDEFADDVLDLVDALGLDTGSPLLGLGHSAGATDLLLAAGRRPGLFDRLVVFEPTILVPRDPEDAPDRSQDLAGALRRRAVFESRREVRDHYRGRGFFAGWQDSLLDAYIDHGFAAASDGSVTLRCTPEIEHALLTRIYTAMSGTYTGTVFDALERIVCPVHIVTTEESSEIYGEMAAEGAQRIGGATTEHLERVGHAVGQTDPGRVIEVVRRVVGA